jgi:hypothetical protein
MTALRTVVTTASETSMLSSGLQLLSVLQSLSGVKLSSGAHQ